MGYYSVSPVMRGVRSMVAAAGRLIVFGSGEAGPMQRCYTKMKGGERPPAIYPQPLCYYDSDG